MQYPDLATAQARLTYRLASFLLENLAAGHTVEWMDAFRAQRHAAEPLGITDRELPWLATRVDPQGHRSFGRRMSGKIIGGDCGRAFGHKTWHSGTPNRVDVWECPTNYVKRRTCATSHLYQEVLPANMGEALQVLAGRNRAAVDQAVDSLRARGARRRPSTLHTAIDKLPGFAENRRDGRSNALIANVLEHGCSNQPARPFLAPTRSQTRRGAVDAMKQALASKIEQVKP